MLALHEVLPATPRARIVRLDLGTLSFPYFAGQAVLIASRADEQRKPYSIAGSPEDASRDRCLELLVGIDANGSPGTHLTLEAGTPVDVEGPVGRFTFPLSPEEDRFVFIAGGTGIAPLRAMLRHALQTPHNRIGLFYSARTPGEFAYEGELQSLAREGRIELRQTVTRDVAGEFRVPQRELQPECHRLRMDAMRAADHRRVAMLIRPCADRPHELLEILQNHVAGVAHLQGEGGIDDIRRGEAEMEPAAGWRADVFSDVCGKGDDVVVEGFLQLLATFQAEGGFGLHLFEIPFRHQPLTAEGFGGKQFDLQPDFQFALLAPKLAHLRARITLNHAPTLAGR